MSTELFQKVAKYIEASGAILSAAEKQAAAQEAAQAKIDTLVPSVVETLIKHKRIPEGLRKEATEVLKDHAKTLEVLANTAAHRVPEEEVAPLGRPEGQTKAAAARNGVSGPYCGSKDPGMRESDRVFMERLGLSVS